MPYKLTYVAQVLTAKEKMLVKQGNSDAHLAAIVFLIVI